MPEHVWQLRTRTLRWQHRPLIVGILNVTPDSFSDGGRYLNPDAAVSRALEMEAQGADIIDLGGESTRPGSQPISPEEELRRIVPVLEGLQGRLSIPLSVDTWKASVAEAALHFSAEIINDVSALRWDPGLQAVLQRHRPGYVLMHAQGQPATMQQLPAYTDVATEVRDFLRDEVARLTAAGLSETAIVLDPGIGFGKTTEHNLTLMRDLNLLTALSRPVLVGLSRKSFLKLIGGSDSLEITTELVQVWSASHGAALWRVHDVAAARHSASWVEALGRGTR